MIRTFLGRLAAVALVALSLSMSLPSAASAQVAPADSAAILLQAADHFASRGEADVAQALYRMIVERFPGTSAAGVAGTRLNAVRSVGVEGGGRVELQVWSTLYGLWLGVAIPGAFGADDSEPYGLGLLLGGPAGFVAGRALSRSGKLTVGQARAITLGGTWGTWQGLGWTEVLDLGTDTLCDTTPYGEYCRDSEDDTEEKFAGMIVGGVVGIAVGSVLARGTVSPGVATATNFGALWGTWFGVAGGVLADLEDDKLLGAALLGGNAGLVSMAVLSPFWNVSRSRARLVSIAGVIGGLSGLGIDLLAQPDGEKVAIGIPLATSVAGLAFGIGMTRDMDEPDVPEDRASGGALLNLADGEWSVGAPLPLPRTLQLDTPAGTLRRTALSFNLLNARFR